MDNDPALDGGHIELFQRQLSMIIRSDTISMEDTVMSRIFKGPQGFKIELTSQCNISFLYVCHMERRQVAKLLEETEEEGLWFRDIFSGQHVYQLYLKTQKEAILRVSEEQKYKHYDLATLNFLRASQQQIQKSVMFRYRRMQSREQMLEGYLENMQAVIRTKNPSLLLQLEKTKKNVFK